MPDTKANTGQGKSIFSIAKEVNRQSTEVLDYLKRIGIEVSGIMSKVDDSVYKKVLGHFKSDIEVAEKHKQKLMEFKKKHKTVEINEIEEELKRDKDKKLKEEEERNRKLLEEEQKKIERELQIQRDLDEKRRLIELKKEQIEREKREKEERELALKKQAEEAAAKKAAEEEAAKKSREEKPVKPEVKEAKETKEVKEVKEVKKEAKKETKPEILTEIPVPKQTVQPMKQVQPKQVQPQKPGTHQHRTGQQQKPGTYQQRTGQQRTGQSPQKPGTYQQRTGQQKPPYKGDKKKEGFTPQSTTGKKTEHQGTQDKRPPYNKFKRDERPPFDKKKEGFTYNKPKTDSTRPERTYEKVTIKEDFKKKKPYPGQRQDSRGPFKKSFGTSHGKPGAPGTEQKKDGSPDSAEARKREQEKKNKAKKQKYTDGTEAKKRKKYDEEVLNIEIEDAIRETMAKMDDAGTPTSRTQLRKRKKKERIEQEQKQQEEYLAKQNILQVTEFLSTSELAVLMSIDVNQLIQKAFALGMMVTINQRLDKDLIVLLADEFGYKVDFHKEYEVDLLADSEDLPETLIHRPPVVTIMGHVDHGKTSLLDYIRKANVVAGEAGGITQHIGAYQVKLENGKLITFLDTPGHEAFTAMRARGAQITDIVVLVVAADDSVMPQTIEAINHSLAANVPIIIAVNKIDKPNADPNRIKTQLAEKGILVEEWGGKYQSVEIAAKHGTNVEVLLEKILLEAEVLDLKANADRTARGVIVEAQLDKGKGILSSVLVQKGTLKIGDSFVAGVYSGKVRAMFDERGKRVEVVKPATPVQVLGFDGMPQAGDTFVVLDSEKDTKEISLKRQQLKREQDFRQIKFTTLDDISKQIKEGRQVDLNVIIKGDVDGSVEALSDSLLKLTTGEVRVSVIHKGIGEISENDVLLATASKAIIIGFNVRPNLKARKLAQAEKVDIRLHNIIYDVINEIKLALEGLLEPEKSEEVLATVEVRDTFKVPKVGVVAGCYVLDGKIVRGNKVRLLREGFVIFDGNILSLKRFKDDVREVEAGYECGIGLENFNDIKVADIIESYKIVETKRKLA
ncbi:MAG: translation initiation factor IF-2 [Ignavibacteriae bacterium]|nr:MAG: translation initiation factor IF-2 [Ignavibacteriota bacterium]